MDAMNKINEENQQMEVLRDVDTVYKVSKNLAYTLIEFFFRNVGKASLVLFTVVLAWSTLAILFADRNALIVEYPQALIATPVLWFFLYGAITHFRDVHKKKQDAIDYLKNKRQ